MGRQKYDLSFVVKNWNYLLLLVILVLAFSVRSYHLDYPVIGYHNMKEAHTLMEVRHFYNEGDYLTNKYDYQATLDNPEGIHADNFPLFTWLILIVWKVFGVSITSARIITIIFSLIGIVFIYLISRQLFNNEGIALFSAFLSAVLPLYVFFGRTVFFDTPTLAFALGSVYFFLRWEAEPRRLDFALFIGFLTLAAISKMVFLVILFPIAAIFPYDRIKKKFYRQYLYSLALPIVFFFWTSISHNDNPGSLLSKFTRAYIARFLSKDYWGVIYSYAINDNFTKLGFYLMVIGFIISIFYIKRKANRFLLVWILSVVPFTYIMGWMMSGHNYYQMPFLVPVCMLISFALVIMTNTLLSFAVQLLPGVKPYRQFLLYGIILGFFFLFLFPSFKVSTDRMFDTQFFGLDTAGKYLRDNSAPGERVFSSLHQDSGFFYYSERTGDIYPNNLTYMMEVEDKLNYRWVFIPFNLNGQMLLQSQEYGEVWGYITKNYGLVHIGLIKKGKDVAPLYMLLEKGKATNRTLEEEFNRLIISKPPKETIYELTKEKVTILTT